MTDDGKPLGSEDDVERTQQANHQLQLAVVDVYKRLSGADYGDVHAALEEAISARGLPEQPAPWVVSTASEIAAGRRVVVDAREEQPPDEG